MKLKLSCVLLTLFTATLLVASQVWTLVVLRPVPASENIVLRMVSPYPPSHPSTQTAEYFARLVEEKTGARIRIQVSSNVELGSPESSLEQLQFGGIAFSVVPCLALPAGRRRTDLEAGQPLGADLDTLNLLQMTVLCDLTPDYRCIANNSRPLSGQTDGTGLTLHAYDAAETLQPLKELGFSVVTLSGTSLDSSISHGYLDGVELTFMEYVSSEYFRILPFLSLFDGPKSPDLIIASKVALGNLPVESQNIIADCAAAAAEYHAQILPQSQREAMEQLAQHGVELLPLRAGMLPPEEWEGLRALFVGAAQEEHP